MKPYLRGDVVIIDVPLPASGHVQAGKRPWVVVQNNVAITWGSLQPSMVECEQVRVIDVTEDWKYICTLPPEIMRHVDTALKNAFFYVGGGVDDGE